MNKAYCKLPIPLKYPFITYPNFILEIPLFQISLALSNVRTVCSRIAHRSVPIPLLLMTLLSTYPSTPFQVERKLNCSVVEGSNDVNGSSAHVNPGLHLFGKGTTRKAHQLMSFRATTRKAHQLISSSAHQLISSSATAEGNVLFYSNKESPQCANTRGQIARAEALEVHVTLNPV